MDSTRTLKAGTGMAIVLNAGDDLAIINTFGTQVVDCWALAASDHAEALSTPHSRNAWFRLAPRVGDALLTSKRNPILRLIEDTSPGVHDTLVPSCDPTRYRQLGVEGYHRSCAENFATALGSIDVVPPSPLPSAVNFFMNVPIQANGTIGIAAPVSRPGDRIVLRAEMDCIVVLSSCPHDLKPVPLNGPDSMPRDVEVVVRPVGQA